MGWLPCHYFFSRTTFNFFSGCLRTLCFNICSPKPHTLWLQGTDSYSPTLLYDENPQGSWGKRCWAGSAHTSTCSSLHRLGCLGFSPIPSNILFTLLYFDSSRQEREISTSYSIIADNGSSLLNVLNEKEI